MKEFFTNHGPDLIWGAVVAIGIISVSTMITLNMHNGNKHYYAAMHRCIEQSGTWVSSMSGLCLAPGVVLDAR